MLGGMLKIFRGNGNDSELYDKYLREGGTSARPDRHSREEYTREHDTEQMVSSSRSTTTEDERQNIRDRSRPRGVRQEILDTYEVESSSEYDRHGRKSKRGPMRADKDKDVVQLWKELEILKRYNAELEDKLDAYRTKKRAFKLQIEEMVRSKSVLERELEIARRDARDIEERSRCETDELQTVKNEFRQAEIQLDQIRHLLEERTRELNGAQKFLTQTDSLSGAEVIAMVESLNAEVLQVAAFIADSPEFMNQQSHSKEQIKAAYEVASRILGEDLTRVLQSRSTQTAPELDPTPIQIALQVSMITCCKKIITSWTLGDTAIDNSLHEIYDKICHKEKQAVFGRWRSMTRAQSKSPNAKKNCLSYVTHTAANVLVLAGRQYQETKSNGAFSQRLSMIVELALRLNSVIGEGITSVDMSLLIIRPGSSFNPAMMDDTYADGRGEVDNLSSTAGELVSGTTDLGLQRSSMELGTKPRVDILLKPKVILRSAIQEEFPV